MSVYNTYDYEGMIAETISIQSRKGDFVNAYIAKPLGKGPFPSIVLVHHLPGWEELYKEFTRKFAHHGFIAICPDLYFREGNGTPDDVAAEVRSNGGISDEQAIQDFLGAFLNKPNTKLYRILHQIAPLMKINVFKVKRVVVKESWLARMYVDWS